MHLSDSAKYKLISRLWEHHVIGPIQTNSFVISNKSRESILFDPGGQEAVQLSQTIQENEIEVVAVLATHGQFDHFAFVPAQVKRER